MVQREEDPTVKVEVEENKSNLFIIFIVLYENNTEVNLLTIFLFVNPLSGAQLGKILLEGGANFINFEGLGKVFLINMTNTESKENAIMQIQNSQSNINNNLYRRIAYVPIHSDCRRKW